MYFGPGPGSVPRSASIVGSASNGLLKMNSHPGAGPNGAQLEAHRSQSSHSLRSGPLDIGTPGSAGLKSPPSLASTVLDLSSPTGASAGFVLNEAAMKNLNQLASKLNDVAGGGGGSNGGPSAAIFGRSASAMATINANNPSNNGNSSNGTNSSNGAHSCHSSGVSMASIMAVHQMVAHGTSSVYTGQLSRSPVPSLNGSGSSSKSVMGMSSISSTGPCSTVGPLSIGPSHTTGNGKNHKIMQIRSKFGSLGSQTNQFSSPHGFCLGVNEEIVIADTNNHRICVFEKNGTFKHSFGNAGKDEGQLWYPRKVWQSD